MSGLKLKLIAAASENMGIGINGNIPWKLKNEMAYFSRMTQFTRDSNKKNVVIMGRRSWDCIPPKYRPLPGRISVVLTRTPDALRKSVPDGVYVHGSLDSALKNVGQLDNVENVWVIGGHDIYKLAMEHPDCHRIYLTEIKKHFEADTFFPTIDKDLFRLTEEYGDEAPLIPGGKQLENELEYCVRVYEKKS